LTWATSPHNIESGWLGRIVAFEEIDGLDIAKTAPPRL
jgi:hypothetical protein